MILVKQGQWHREYGTNCQDAAIEFSRLDPYSDDLDNNISFKCIADGCSQGEHSEVGAQLFTFLFKKYGHHQYVFTKLNEMFASPKDMLNYMLFTTLYVTEEKDVFTARICGDGYVILQDHNDNITYEVFEYDGAPPYYAYNFFPKDKLTAYQEGVKFIEKRYLKENYKAVGVASDGLKYVLESEHKAEFEALLINRKLAALKRFCNKHAFLLKDDLSIAI